MNLRTSFVRRAAIFTLLCFVGCTAGPEEKARPRFHLDVDRAGKADGEAMLPAEEMARITAAFETAIQKGEAEVARLESEIKKLEESNRRKQADIDLLVAQISARRSEVERNRNLALVAAGALGIFSFGLGAVVGAAAVGSLAVAYANDQRLQELQRSLARARSEQTALQNQARAYQDQKRAVTAQLTTIRASKSKLLAALQSPDAVALVAELTIYPEAAAALRRVKLLEGILGHTQEEVAALTTLRDAAQALSHALDDALVVLRALVADADQLAKESREAFLQILQAALSGDPLAVATAWLQDELAKKTREILVALDFPLADFVAHLVRTRFTGTPEDIEKLTQKLLARLGGEVVDAAAGWRWSGGDDQPQAIVDFGLISSTLTVPQAGTVKRARLSLRIQHTFPGDLYIWLEHGNRTVVLHAYEDGAGDGIDTTYELTDLIGSDAAGPWELAVGDDFPGDEGRLVSWRLELEGGL